MDLNQTCTVVSQDATITQVDFGDIDLIFKVAHIQRMLKNGFHKCMNINQTRTDIQLRKELISVCRH